eukprot:scaffold66405_cov16-Tisochrysis_lutea.AAC.1
MVYFLGAGLCHLGHLQWKQEGHSKYLLPYVPYLFSLVVSSIPGQSSRSSVQADQQSKAA